MNHKIEQLISYPKSFYVCFKLLPFKQALRCPIFVRYNVKCFSLRGKAIIIGPLSKGMIQIGYQYVGTHDVSHQRSVLEIDGIIEFNGSVILGSGCLLSVGKKGHLVFGSHFNNTSSGHIVCNKKIVFGKRVLMGWDVLVLDTDFHAVENIHTHKIRGIENPIEIGDNVWFGTRSVVLKGSIIASGCIIGALALVSGIFSEENCCIAGNPANVIKRGVTRKL